MANPGDFAQTLKQQADIVRIVGEYVKLRKSGAQNYQGLCPFHQEKTPSFSVHATNQFFHCFGCGVSGDVFSFVQKIENITFPEAVRVIADKLGIPMPKMQYASEDEARQARQRGGLIDIHERACVFFQEQLRKPESAHAREYLKSRGLTPEVIAEFRIGFAPERGFLLRDALGKHFDDEIMRESGLFSWKEREQSSVVSGQLSEGTDGDQKLTTDNWQLTTLYSKFRNRVMFPIANEQGKVIAFTGRTLAADEKAGPKYLNSPETPIYSKSRVLFNIDKAKQAIRQLDYAILVEGQMDCISVYAAGFHNVIASSGTAFTDPQARLLGRFSKNIVVNFDPDTAGAAAAERSLALLVSEDFQIKVLTLETGFDPDLYIRRKGKDAYAEALKDSKKFFVYLAERAQAQFPIRTPEGKTKAISFLVKYLNLVPNAFTRAELIPEIADTLKLQTEFVRKQLRDLTARRASGTIKVPDFAQLTESEEILVQALVSPQSGICHSEADGDFDPGREAMYWLSAHPLCNGLPGEELIAKLVRAYSNRENPFNLELNDFEHRTLLRFTQSQVHVLTPENVRGAVLGLRKAGISRRLKEVLEQTKRLTAASKEELYPLMEEHRRLKLALRSSSLQELLECMPEEITSGQIEG